MADKSFDAIVVGGGHHGTIIACYLAHAGLETAIFERQHELGGGACGEELPLPGFIQNPCAHFTRFYGHPAYEDFNLREKGLVYVFPEQNEGMIFDDDTSFIGYSAWRVVDPITGKAQFSQENAEKTLKEIAKFSERDAETAAGLLEKYKSKWRAAFHEYRYSPPTPYGVKDALERLIDDPEGGIEPVYELMTSQQLAYDLFESPELRTLFMRSVETSTGSFAQDVIGLYVYIHTIGLMLSWEPAAIVLGGTHTITHALQRAFAEMGGKYFVSKEVDKVLIENGVARGIRLADGSEIEARKLVVSDLGANQTILRLIGEDIVGHKIAHRVRNINYDRAQLFWGNLAMHELPKYKVAAANPEVGPQPRLYWGPKDPDYLATRYQAEIFTQGYPSKMFILTAPDSIWDRTRVPTTKHTILVEEFTAPHRMFSDRQWLRMKKDIVDEILKQWQVYAPNMTRDNVIGSFITTPYDVVNRNIDMLEGGWVEGSMIASQLGRYRPTPELAHYRTPVKNLYICSSNLHSGGGIGRGSSYCCYKKIAEDHGLRKVWEEKGRPY
ncbi:MAG: NAD(P)/FAD-dependent oxidoreductase [Chloroflexi bacterium]|nr:NAD(P)/FAD-dependent oxidoreductase [Chloroflexota bacterium]MDA8188079.1 NAD(P)/FAD-dependent oxidoreductase [Dehalococcoidales bacterium]